MSDATQAEPAKGLSAELSERFQKFQALYHRWLAARAACTDPDGPEDDEDMGVRFKVMRSTLSNSTNRWRLSRWRRRNSATRSFGHFSRSTLIFEIEFASIVSAVENSEGNLKEADAAEERIIEEMRQLGREAMQGWAERQVEVTEQEIRQQPQMHRQGKKNSAGIRNSAISRS